MAAKNNVQMSIFYNVKNGKFQTMANENEPNAIKVQAKKDPTKFYFVKEFNQIFSFLKGISVATETYENQNYEVVSLKLNDGKDSEQIQFNIESNLAPAYIGRLAALCNSSDILNEIEICVGLDENKRTFGYIRQNGINVKSIYNKTNKLPKWTEIPIPNKPSVWDKSEQTKALKIEIEKINNILGYKTTTEIKNPLSGVDDTNGIEKTFYYTKKGSPLTYEEAKIAHDNGQPLYDSSKNIIQFDDMPF